MPLDLSDTLVIGISSTALFDLNEADAVFRKNYDTNPARAIEEYRKYME
ncbi:MAG TPA: 5'-nucleotidase, partial [Bacteroidetes bacterium]|nr:5'-nucleotidase [Bacteroidota bacterium]